METPRNAVVSLTQLVCEQLGLEQGAIRYDATWAELGADSLDRMQLSLAIEQLFRVDIPHPVGEQLNTLGDTLEHVCGLLAARRALSEQDGRQIGMPGVAMGAWAKGGKHPHASDLESRQQVLQHLGKVISEVLEIQPEWVTQNATWLQLGADSLDRLAISLAIEDTFNVSIPHQVGESLNTVGDTLDHVWGLVSVGHPRSLTLTAAAPAQSMTPEA